MKRRRSGVRLWRMVRISVVVPAHNEEEVLPACLAALRSQSISEFELIVVDSASTDRTGEVARAHGAQVVRVERPGLARARQAGFEAASGEIVATTDADSQPPPDWLARLGAALADPEVVGVYGGLRLDGRGPWVRAAEGFFLLWQISNHFLGRPLFCGPNFAVRKQAFEEVGGFRRGEAFYDDDETDIRLAFKLRRIGKVVFLPDLLVTTSMRKLSGPHGLRYLIHHIRNYFRLCWLSYGKV